MLAVATDELRNVLELLNTRKFIEFSGKAGSGKTTVAKKVVEILRESNDVVFVTDDALDGTFTRFEDALLHTKDGDVLVTDLRLSAAEKASLLSRGVRFVTFTQLNHAKVVTDELNLDDRDTAFNVSYFIENV